MIQKFKNDLLSDAVESGTPLDDALYSLRPRDFIDAAQRIEHFPGTKVMLSCTDQTPLAEVVKQALFFADLVIIVPAPLWVSCGDVGSHPFAEFNYQSTGLFGSCHFSAGLLRNLSRLIAQEAQLVHSGAVTFLPVLGESQYRWGFGELPGPSSGDASSPLSVHTDALYGLCSERLSAERFGSMHLNAASFTKPVFGDLTIGQRQNGNWVHYLWEVSVPDLSTLSMSDVIGIRHELPEASDVSRATTRVLNSGDADNAVTQEMVKDLQNSAATLTQRIESKLAPFGTGNHLPKTTVVLGSGGLQGGISATVDFVRRGGTLRDLARLITVSGDKRLEFTENSFWAASY